MKIAIRQPKADKEQRRHLLIRVDERARDLERQIHRAHNAIPEPPEVIAAQKIIDDYTAAQRDIVDADDHKIGRVRSWLREQVLFGGAVNALSLVKQFEIIPLEEAKSAGASMEDRNDPPIGLLNISDSSP